MADKSDKKPIRVSAATYEAIKASMNDGETLVDASERIFAAGIAALAFSGKAALPAGDGAGLNAYTAELVTAWSDPSGKAVTYGDKAHKLVECGIGRFEALRKDREKNLAKKATMAGKVAK